MSRYNYQIGEIVNNSLKIVKQIRKGKKKEKAYKVQSTTYPKAPIYEVTEDSIKKGKKDGYLTGHRVFEGNSIYSIEYIRPYIVDIEEAKTISKGSRKYKIKVRCDNCNREKIMTPNKLVERGFSCNFCSSNISYPELFMMAYLEVKGIKYEYQKVFKDLPNRRFDFYLPESNTVIETHGIQHYQDSGYLKNSVTLFSDKDKELFCYNENINYRTIDCRKSNFKYIKSNVEKELQLINPSEENKILEFIKENKKYPFKEIISSYQEGKTTYEISKIFNVSNVTISNILKRNGIDTSSKRKVICLNNSKVFNSVQEASTWCGLKSRSNITLVCKGLRNYAGKINGEPLKWAYVEE